VKLDSFPFHGESFRRATAGWPKAKIGAYLLLLWHQWVEHSIPADDLKKIASILGESRIQTLKLWTGELAAKFPAWQDGRYRNRRLEAERERVLEEIRRRSDHGRAGANARWGRGRKKKAAPASNWKRAIALAHTILDEMPRAGVTEWREEFKDRAAKQGIPYGERGGKSQAPLYVRSIEYAMEVKAQRIKKGEPAAWGRQRKR
jgi:uncharacterized protein YdaU (DUF1376 family)